MVDRLNPQPKEVLEIGNGVSYFAERVPGNSETGMGGEYAGWGLAVANEQLPSYVEEFLGRKLEENETLELTSKGFDSRFLTLHLSEDAQKEIEIAVGERLVRGALEANKWEPDEIGALFIGTSIPTHKNYTADIAQRTGIPDTTPKISVHTACDSSMRALNTALKSRNLQGRKVLIGGIENLSHGLIGTKDTQALQLFGNGGAVIGIVPGESLTPIVSRSETIYDAEGALQVAMAYDVPEGDSPAVDFFPEENHIIIAGRLPEPEDGSSIKMKDNRGMLKLFGYNTADIVAQTLNQFRSRTGITGNPDEWFDGVIMHHANYKIAESQSRRLERVYGLELDLTKHFIVREFGNVSAASPMISWLKQADRMKEGTRWLFVGYGAGGYYDTIIAEVPKK